MVDTPKVAKINEAAPKPQPQAVQQPSQQQPTHTQPTPQAQKQEPQKTVALSQNPKKESQAFDGMTVAQKLNYLNIKEKRGILTPDERKLKEDLKDQLSQGKDGNEGEVTPEDGTKVGPSDEEPKDLFKEQDIIDYMYNDWLLGGANWLYKKTYKKIDQFGQAFKNRCAQAKNDAKKRENAEYNTITTRNNIDDKAVKMYDGSKASIEKGRDGVKATLDAIMAGNIDGSKATECTKILMNELSEDKRQAFCQQAKVMIENLAENMKTIQFVAGQLARAQMGESICMNQDVFKNTNTAQLYEALTKRNAIAIARKMDSCEKQGKDPAKFLKNLTDDVTDANKFTDKQYKKHKFDEAGKKGNTNKTLHKINDRLSLKQDNITQPERLEPQSMLEHLVASNNFDLAITDKLNKMRGSNATLEARNDNYEARRRNFRQRIRSNYRESIQSRINPQGRIAGDRQGQLQAQQQRQATQNKPQHGLTMDSYRLALQQRSATK